MLRVILSKPRPELLLPLKVCVTSQHQKSCPAQKPKTCPGSKGASRGSRGGGGGGGPGSVKIPDFKRAERTAPCRLGLLPEEWFTFFLPKTGVSGPYVFLLVFSNYLISKEIFIMEHEYYLGISIFIVIYYITTNFGRDIGASIDKDVDAELAAFEADRKSETDVYENAIKDGILAQERAKGQEMLMAAKKENIDMQLEAIYRERLLLVHSRVKGRMDYHVKLYRTQARIHQRWMIDWILENVRKSITPEFEKEALDSAIRDLAAIAGRAK